MEQKKLSKISIKTRWDEHYERKVKRDDSMKVEFHKDKGEWSKGDWRDNG